MVVDIVMGNTIEMSWTVVPQDVNDREVFEWVPAMLKRGSAKAKEG